MIALDSQQDAAVRAPGHRVMVLAGAGSGKTRVLIERIAHLVEDCKVSPYECLAFTFTRKAAGEIKERLVERIAGQAYHCYLGTMHALALSMINRFGDVIGMKARSVTVYSSWEENYLLKEVAMDMGIHTGKAWRTPKKEIDAVFAEYYQKGIEPEEDNPIRPLFLAFIQRCRENNSTTYGGLLVGLRLLIPTLATYMDIKHILVDEVQDIDSLQWAIIREMEQAFNASLYVVGDIDQSIYEWRGAAPKYLVDHQDEFDIFRMEMNYRSMPEIVTAANTLISHNQDRITKTMVASRIAPELAPGCVQIHGNTQSERVVSVANAWQGGNDEPLAILARTHGLLQKIDRLMDEANIPHEYIGKTTALTNSEPFRRFHAFLKLTVNVYDNFSFLLIKDLVGVTREEYGQIRIEAAEQSKSHFQVWFQDRKGYEFFGAPYSLNEMIEYMNKTFPELSSESIAFINQFGNGRSVAGYLDWLATYDIQDEIKGDLPGISLMTIHAAKGLEWPVVIVAGCNEGILPSSQAVKNDDVEAERRLAYVAWTRARDQLVITVRPEVDELTGKTSPASRFIWESSDAIL